MPNTYTQIYIHYAFATRIRLRLLTEVRQKEHHQGESFPSEYETFLTKYRINYDKQYVFHDPEG